MKVFVTDVDKASMWNDAHTRSRTSAARSVLEMVKLLSCYTLLYKREMRCMMLPIAYCNFTEEVPQKEDEEKSLLSKKRKANLQGIYDSGLTWGITSIHSCASWTEGFCERAKSLLRDWLGRWKTGSLVILIFARKMLGRPLLFS